MKQGKCLSCNGSISLKTPYAKYCNACRRQKKCKCGCGKIDSKTNHVKLKTPTRKKRRFKRNCRFCDKVFNTTKIATITCPECRRNPPKGRVLTRVPIKEHTNSKGEVLRSTLEVLFSEMLISNKIDYEYEGITFELIQNEFGLKRKVIDFKVGETLIEITGLVKDKKGILFKRKLKTLRKTTDQKIIVVASEKKCKKINSLTNYQIKVLSLEDIQKDFNLLKEQL